MSLLSGNLQAFSAIVQQSTVHGAAKQLGLTQTAVTQRIRALETELGTTLFLRSRRGMTLTQEGQALLRYCNGAKDLEGEALSQIGGAGSERASYVAIVGPTSVMSSRVIDLCSGLYKEWPNLFLNFIVNDAEDRLGLVRAGKAALAIVPPEQVPNEMDSKVLKPEKYVLVAASDWKRRKLSEILENERVIDFDEKDQTSHQYLKEHGLLGKLRRPRLFANSNDAIIKLFANGVGFGTLTQEVAKPHLESGELILLNGGAVMTSPLALTWYPRPEMPDYFGAILRTLK